MTNSSAHVDVHLLTAREIAARIRSGSLSSQQIIKAFVDRINTLNPQINALRFSNQIDALRQAAEIDKDRNKAHGRLAGVPFSAKDHINVSGLPRSDGTLLGSTDSCPNNATIARLLLDEGAICIGKANMAEYGKSYYTDNVAYGRTTNPFGVDFTPGGSGGGDAAAVAAGMACFGIGADSGGSVRVPANFCGLFGLFPSPGAISSAGFTAYSHTTRSLFRSPGPITRSIDDLELLTSILATYDSEYPDSTPFPAQLPADNAGCKVAIVDSINATGIDPEITSALQATESLLRKKGYTPVRTTLPTFDRCYELFIILAGQSSLIIDDIVAQMRGLQRDPDTESDAMKSLRRRIASELPALTAESLLTCWHGVGALRNSLKDLFSEFSYILAPVCGSLPPRHGTSKFETDGNTYESQEVFQYSSTANVLGIPALAFPTHLSKSGLPVGLQLMGPRFSDFDLIRLVRDLGFKQCLRCPL